MKAQQILPALGALAGLAAATFAFAQPPRLIPPPDQFGPGIGSSGPLQMPADPSSNWILDERARVYALQMEGTIRQVGAEQVRLAREGEPDAILAVQPQVDQQGQLLVAINVISRRVEDLDEFTEALQESGAFSNALMRQSEALEDGTLRAVIQGYYMTPSPEATEPAARESDSARAASSTVAEAAR